MTVLMIILYLTFGFIFGIINFIKNRKVLNIPIDQKPIKTKEIFLIVLDLAIWPIHIIYLFLQGWRIS